MAITVQKATPTCSAWPSASVIIYGQLLSSSVLAGGSCTVPGTFEWTAPSTAPGTGSTSEGVSFTPADTTDYNSFKRSGQCACCTVVGCGGRVVHSESIHLRSDCDLDLHSRADLQYWSDTYRILGTYCERRSPGISTNRRGALPRSPLGFSRLGRTRSPRPTVEIPTTNNPFYSFISTSGDECRALQFVL